MAAKLTWDGDRFMLGGKGGWTLGAVRSEGGLFRAVLNRSDVATRERYEDRGDAAQDLEAEVRRLLRDAGVDVQ
jgi:hypothetical protein